MKSGKKLMMVLALSLVLSACGVAPDAERTQNPEVTEENTDTLDDTEGESDAGADTPASETETPAVTETETAEEEAAATEDAQAAAETETTEAAQTQNRVRSYAVDFSDVEGIRSMTAGHADDRLLVLANVSPAGEAEQEIAVFTVDGDSKNERFRFTIPQNLEFIGAVSGDDDSIVFSAVNRTDENLAAAFTMYRVDLDDQEVHTLYEGQADALNYGHNLVADDDRVFFTENMWEQDGLYFADVVMVKGDAKQVVNVEVFPSEHVSLLLDDDALMYAAARNDEQFIVVFEEGNETREYQVAGDNPNFRLTDADDGVFLLDNYNGHPEMLNAMVLEVNTHTTQTRALSAEGQNLHTARYADDDFFAVASEGRTAGWVRAAADQTLEEVSETVDIPEGSALTGAFEDDDRIIRYPQPVSDDYYTQFRLVYQIGQ